MFERLSDRGFDVGHGGSTSALGGEKTGSLTGQMSEFATSRGLSILSCPSDLTTLSWQRYLIHS
ncbi:hypothetical protein BN903_13 [Halorubrum sp. AJ67]|nr:hypothetical protein BN903_13 [Halorubrum sp. AJ67]